ncbi:hypothetical protein CLM76_09420 [Vreelandella venusta]|nr:hypothetical protein CLM76_09420 [Halomonas hydrothermalis]
MSPEAFFQLAQELVEKDCEASARSAASRAYYSAFLEARSRTDDIELYNPPPQSHKRVRVKVNQRYGFQMKEALLFMSIRRNEADYDLHDDFSKEDALQLMHIRQNFIEGLQ